MVLELGPLLCYFMVFVYLFINDSNIMYDLVVEALGAQKSL